MLPEVHFFTTCSIAIRKKGSPSSGQKPFDRQTFVKWFFTRRRRTLFSYRYRKSFVKMYFRHIVTLTPLWRSLLVNCWLVRKSLFVLCVLAKCLSAKWFLTQWRGVKKRGRSRIQSERRKPFMSCLYKTFLLS